MIFFVSLPKPKQTNMKKFAFPLSVKCASIEERDECLNLLESIGYENAGDFEETARRVITNYGKFSRLTTAYPDDALNYHNNRHYIDHFNPDLIRDIAAACTNDEWHKMEPVIRHDGSYGYTNDLHKLVSVKHSSHRRPTLAEICEHHGYEIKGSDIVKKVETVSNCHKSYCETANDLQNALLKISRIEKFNELLKDEIKRLESENAELKRKNDPHEFHPINLPYMFQTKPAEFSEREKKRLLRLAERIEKLIK